MNYSNYTKFVLVKNDSIIGNFDATFVICNSKENGGDLIFFYSDAHIFSYLTLYKQGKKNYFHFKSGISTQEK